MPWFKVDDSFESHPKVKAIPRARRIKAIGLWTLAGSWSARQLTDGFVPSYMLDELAGSKTEANTLVEVGLWSAIDGGYVFKDWHDWQPTKAKVEADREAAKERMRSARERKKGSGSADVRANTSATPPNRSREVRSTPGSLTPTRPDPTRPDQEEKTLRPLGSETDRFDEFWDTYDHKLGRKKAETAYRAALKKPGVTADLLIASAASYIEWQRAEAKHPQYTKHAATWLHGEHWRDERPARQQPRTRVQEHLALVQQLAAEEQQPIPFPRLGGAR